MSKKPGAPFFNNQEVEAACVGHEKTGWRLKQPHRLRLSISSGLRASSSVRPNGPQVSLGIEQSLDQTCDRAEDDRMTAPSISLAGHAIPNQ
jgi:hypothetical protein